MKCKDVRQWLSLYLDGELDTLHTDQVKMHLDHCSDCFREYEDLVEITGALRQLGRDVLPAPPEAKDMIMNQIRQQAQVNTNRWKSPSLWAKWGAAAAAVVFVLVAGRLTWFPQVNVADNEHKYKEPPAVVQPDKENPAGTALPGVSQAGDKTVPDKIPGKPGESNDPTGEVKPGNKTSDQQPGAVLLNQEQLAITSTLIKMKAFEGSSGLSGKTVAMTNELGLAAENLGQQVNNQTRYNVVKVTVPRSSLSIFNDRLARLGIITSEQSDRQDISTAYNETLNQYSKLLEKRNQANSPQEQQRLDKQIDNLNRQLQTWQEQTENVTVILWLEE
ncbi:zf-HC2 domain-containing protein [Syntrophomonas erecta]